MPPSLPFASKRILTALAVTIFVACSHLGWAKIGVDLQAPLGNPDGAITEAASRTKYLIQRKQFHLSYNDDTHQANWVSWSYSSPDTGSQSRTDAWAVEELLPTGYLRIGTSPVGTHFGIQWDRGHMTPSADRTTNYEDNAATFRMSNIIPQASKNNQGLWANFETYCRGLAVGDKEVLIISGPSEFTGDRIPNSMAVPGSVWKIAVIVSNASSSTPAHQRITPSDRVIAIMTPNVSDGLGTWQSYITSVEEIEEVTGLNFFTSVDPSTAIYLKNLVDTGTGPNSPTVITTFNPTLGAVGTTVTISGYNFDGSSTVQFNGQTVSANYVNPNTLTAVVPAGATSGPITVTGPSGTDVSYEDFTVLTGSTTPTFSVSPASLAGLTATEGTAGAAEVYAVNGSNLTDVVVITAPGNFEVSKDGSSYATSQSLQPAIDGSLAAQIHVRIAASAASGNVSGQIAHSSAGAAAQSVNVSGSVTPSSPTISLSTASLGGFTTFQAAPGASKSYTVTGFNLTGNITITAPSGYEISLDNSNFSTTLALAPSNGSIATTTIHARLGASAPLGTVDGSISHVGGAAATKSISVSGTVSAQSEPSTIYWNFETATPTSGVPVDLTVGAVAQGNNNGTTTLLTTTSASRGYTGASGNNNAGAAARTGELNTASNGSAYFEFTITPATGRTFTLSETSSGTRSTSTGPQAYTLRSSADNYTTDLATGSIGNDSKWTLRSNTGLNQSFSSATTFRLYGHNGTGSAATSTANWRIDDLKIIVSTATALSPAPVITISGPASATALESFSYQITASNNPDSYAASGLPAGLNLNSATGLISGTPTTLGTYTVGLTASNEGGDGTATLTINVLANPNAPSITSNLITSGQINTAFSYQITASNSPTSYTAANLPAGLAINTSTGLISGTPTAGGSFNATITALNNFGSDSKTLQILIRVPALALTPTVLSPFATDAGIPSPTQSYTLSGTELIETITVRAPQHYEISAGGSPFTTEIPLTPSGEGTLSQTITVRLGIAAPPGIATGTISHTGSGATPQYLEVTGTVSTADPTLTVSTASLAPFSTAVGTPSDIQTYEVSGAGLEGAVTIAAPTGFEIGPDEESFGEQIILTPSGSGALVPTAIYVRLRDDTAAGSYSGAISHGGGGSATQNVAVSGTVSAVSGPNIVATSGGSTYVSTSYSYTIRTDGQQKVTSYNATGLPNGVSINTSTGVISGTPSAAGTFPLVLSATSSQGTSTKPYTLRVISSAEQPLTPTVVINKYHNSTVDRVELMVTGDEIDGPPVDLRGMIFKDFNSNMATDGGGKYVFNNHPLWSNVKAGTLIVLAAGNTAPEDLDPADFVLQVNLANPTYFTEESGGFDIGNIDMVMIKPAGTQPDGVAGGMHALAAGSTSTQFNNFTGRKTRANRELAANRGYFCYVVNSNGSLADFYANNAASITTTLTFGQPHTAGNQSFILSLRNKDQDGPVITLNGANPVNLVVGDSYTDAGATAFDAGDNTSRPVNTTGTVNTNLAGTYTLTYTATDSKGNIGTATRTVNVLAPAMALAIVGTSTATATSATAATLNGNVQDQGSSAVTARGFVYSTVSMTLETGADGTVTVTSGGGGGPFNATPFSLSPGTTYYFRAFATNATGTSYGETLSFTTLKAEPLSHATNFAAGTITTSSIAATWTGADADGYLLVVGSGVLTAPQDGVPVADDTDVNDGHGAINLPASATSYAGFTGFVSGTSYSFRLYPFNNSGSSIDYKISGAPTFTAGVLTTPELSVSGSPTPLTTTYGTPSSATTFTVSGVYLTSTVSITAPSGFEVSADNATFANTITISPASGTLPGTAVYLRLTATAAVGGTYDAQTITVSGGGAPSVTINTAASGYSVTPKSLGITGLAAATKIYNGTTAAAITGSARYEGLVNNESFLVIHSVTWAFADKNVGTNKVLVRTGDFTAPSANYTIEAQPSLAADITPKPLTVTGATVTTRTYDGTSTAAITGATLVGVVNGDTVTVTGGGTFDDANAGINKPVTANIVLGGTDAANYTLTQPSLTGTITKADQTITFASLPGKNLGDAPFELLATSSSGLNVSYTSSNSDVASVSDSTVTVLSVGTTTITANQSGDTNHNPATPIARTLTVTNTPTLLAGWDFQTTTNGGTAAAASPATPKTYNANFGLGTIHLDGTNGSNDWFVPASGSTGTEVNGFGGTTVNATGALSPVTTSPSALAILGGTSEAANGKRIVFAFSMAGRANLAVSYATQRTSAGFSSQQWEYSSDGTNWSPLATIQSGEVAGTITTAFGTTGVISLPTVTALDNATAAYLRLTVTGATASRGNNRIDNIQLIATAYTPTDTTPPVITVLGDNPLTLASGTTFTDPGATAEDETDGLVLVSTSGEVDTSTPGTYTVTYTAQDAASNTAEATRTVIVVDLTPPVITLLGDNPFYVALNGTFTDPGATALDAVDGQVAVQSDTSAVDTALRGSYLVTYTATDAAGNTTIATRTVQVGASNATFILETEYGLSGADAAFTADPDGDGVPNLMEYAFGSDPSSAAAKPAQADLQPDGDNVRFTAIVRNDDSLLTITPRITSDPRQAWTAEGIVELENISQHNVPDGFIRRTWEITEPDPETQFIRFEVSYE